MSFDLIISALTESSITVRSVTILRSPDTGNPMLRVNGTLISKPDIFFDNNTNVKRTRLKKEAFYTTRLYRFFTGKIVVLTCLELLGQFVVTFAQAIKGILRIQSTGYGYQPNVAG
jgi:hypothetical protein